MEELVHIPPAHRIHTEHRVTTDRRRNMDTRIRWAQIHTECKIRMGRRTLTVEHPLTRCSQDTIRTILTEPVGWFRVTGKHSRDTGHRPPTELSRRPMGATACRIHPMAVSRTEALESTRDQ